MLPPSFPEYSQPHCKHQPCPTMWTLHPNHVAFSPSAMSALAQAWWGVCVEGWRWGSPPKALPPQGGEGDGKRWTNDGGDCPQHGSSGQLGRKRSPGSDWWGAKMRKITRASTSLGSRQSHCTRVGLLVSASPCWPDITSWAVLQKGSLVKLL